MIEQLNEDIPENLVASVLYQMELTGEIEKRLVMTPTRPGQVIDGANCMSSPYSLYEFKRPDLVNRSRGEVSVLSNQFL